MDAEHRIEDCTVDEQMRENPQIDNWMDDWVELGKSGDNIRSLLESSQGLANIFLRGHRGNFSLLDPHTVYHICTPHPSTRDRLTISWAYKAAVGRQMTTGPSLGRGGSSYYSTAEDVHSLCQLPHPDEIFWQVRCGGLEKVGLHHGVF